MPWEEPLGIMMIMAMVKPVEPQHNRAGRVDRQVTA